MHRRNPILALLLTLALAMPALALPCAAMGWGSDMAMDDACPLMQAMGDDCGGPSSEPEDGPQFARALPDCCVVTGGEPAAMPSGVLVATPQPSALQPMTEASTSTLAVPTDRPAPAPSPPRSATAPLFTLHASLLI